jgi:endonuclease G
MFNSIEPETLQAARHARNLAAAMYLYNPRVTLIDVGWRRVGEHSSQMTDELTVRVHVRNKPRGPSFEAFTQSRPDLVIDKNRIPFPVDIVEGIYHLHQTYWMRPPRSRRAQVFDVLRGGISVSNEWFYNYGTLGGIVEDRRTGASMILSAWHVLAGSVYAPHGLPICQPGYGDGGGPRYRIATLERHAMDQGIDAAVARLTGARAWDASQFDLGPVTGVAEPTLGMEVIKSGRGSDITRGVIDGIDGEFTTRYGGFIRKIKHVQRIVPLKWSEIVSSPGDSGAWWLQRHTNRVVALHFAGSNWPEVALAIAMPQVLDALEVSVVTQVEGVPTRERRAARVPTSVIGEVTYGSA